MSNAVFTVLVILLVLVLIVLILIVLILIVLVLIVLVVLVVLVLALVLVLIVVHLCTPFCNGITKEVCAASVAFIRVRAQVTVLNLYQQLVQHSIKDPNGRKGEDERDHPDPRILQMEKGIHCVSNPCRNEK